MHIQLTEPAHGREAKTARHARMRSIPTRTHTHILTIQVHAQATCTHKSCLSLILSLYAEELPESIVQALEQVAAAACLMVDSGAAAVRMLATSKRAYTVRMCVCVYKVYVFINVYRF